jgi:hypothetical protein
VCLRFTQNSAGLSIRMLMTGAKRLQLEFSIGDCQSVVNLGLHRVLVCTCV